MNKDLLITGVDPGTTLGYALIDLNGNIVSIKSSKQLELNSLISEIISYGVPILIGTDRKDIPQFIAKLGAKLGAKIVTSEKDMPVGYKKALTKEFEKKYKNDHEMDALAGAIYAFRKYKPLLEKIDSFVKKEGKQNLKKDLISIVIKNELSIKLALEILESPEREETKIIKKAIDERKFDLGFLKLYDKFKRAQKEIFFLKKQNDSLKKQLKETGKRISYINKKINQLEPDEKAREQLKFKEIAIQKIAKDLDFKNQEVKELYEAISNLNAFIPEVDKNVLIKKIKNLGAIEFENKNRLLRLKKGDVLLVDDLSIISEKTINLIKSKVDLIIFRGNLNKTLEKEFILISAAKLNLNETKHFALVDPKELEKEKINKKILAKVIEEYKKERIK